MACLLIYLYKAVSTKQSSRGHFQHRDFVYVTYKCRILVKRVSAYTVVQHTSTYFSKVLVLNYRLFINNKEYAFLKLTIFIQVHLSK